MTTNPSRPSSRLDPPYTQGAPLLAINGVCKAFGENKANEDISLHLVRGEILSLLGENGAGKTTLMNILFGHYVADAGSIFIDGKPLPPGSTQAAIRAGIGMVHQHFALADGLTVLENIILGTGSLWRWRDDRPFARARLQELMDAVGLSVDLDARIDTLTVGEQQRAEILKVLYRDARVLILDEPTAILSPQEAHSLFNTLRALVARGLAVILISHKLEDVLKVSDRIAVLRDGQVVGVVPATTAKHEQLVELMVGRPVKAVVHTPCPAGEVVCRLKGVHVQAVKGRDRLVDINLTVRAHEIIGVAGIAGNGQSMLANVIYGMARPQLGDIYLYGKKYATPQEIIDAGVGRICEDRLGMGVIAGMTVAENMASSRRRGAVFARRGWRIDAAAVHAGATKHIARFDIRCRGGDQSVAELSGGNIQKLILGRELDGHPRFILAHQPSRGLDAGAISFVHQQLQKARDSGAGVLLISEDLDELLALSDRIAVMYEGALSAPMTRDQVTVPKLGLLMSGQVLGAGAQVDDGCEIGGSYAH